LLVRAANANLVARLSGPRLANEVLALMNERHPEAAIRRLRGLRLLRFLHPRLRVEKQTERLLDVLPAATGTWNRQHPGMSLDRPLLWVMALLGQASSPVIVGTARRLQFSASQSRALEWAGERSSRIAEKLSTAQALRPSQIYRLLAGVPGEALALVLAKALVSHRGKGAGRLTQRLRRYVQHDRHVTSTIDGDMLKQFGLRPGPRFKEILGRLLDERLDGRIVAASEEKARARTLVEQYS
jgi:tRNA nucleotidyltransferase (CCA-adding enzyme)